MAKTKFFFIALVVVFAFTSYSCTQGVRGEGVENGVVKPQGETKGSEEGKTQGPAPKKKPRLKYWDPYECGC